MWTADSTTVKADALYYFADGASYFPPGPSAPALNDPRPQNMPPNGLVSPSGTYVIKVVAVYNGIETTMSADRIVTVNPTSIMLVTPMKRLWPFPNTGLD